MSNNNLSLDDIIKQSKSTMRGRGGSYRGSNRGFPRNQMRGGINKSNRGHVRTNISARGRGSKIVTDARMKIIEKNRLKLTDARDKLAEKAKQTDARLKLDKLRASHFKKNNLPMSGISRKTGKNGRITLTTNNGNMQNARAVVGPFPSHMQNMVYPSPVIPNETQYATNMNFLEPQTLRRTVSNEYAPAIIPPPPPVFNFKPMPTYSWKRNHGDVDDWNFMAKMRNHRDIGVKSRLETVTIKPGIIGGSGRPKASNTSSQTTGYRIIVSNLQSNVTQEDIKELFEDVGDLLVSRLVRPGTAEVIYKTLKDAMKAVETYHNRQLDGHPMKCLLVNPRSKNNPIGAGVRLLNE